MSGAPRHADTDTARALKRIAVWVGVKFVLLAAPALALPSGKGLIQDMS